MQKAIQLFEQDFARWGLHVPEADAATRKSGVVHEAGWHVLYDFGQDSRGEFLDYYAALRDAPDPAVTDDWHVRLYETGDRVQLPTVLEAYMYSRDPTPEELARARRKFANPQAPTVAPKPASPRPASPQPANPHPASPQPASQQPASQQPASSPPVAVPSATTALDEPSPASDDIALEVGLDLALAGVEPEPGGDTLASWLMTPAFGSAIIEPAKAAAPPPKPAPSPKPKPAAPADDDALASDLVFVSEQPPARMSDRKSERKSDRISNPTAAIATDDDTFTISMGDDEAPDKLQGASQGAPVEGFDHYHTPTRSSGRSAAATEADALAADALAVDALALEAEAVSPDDEGAASIPPAQRRHSPAPNAMLTTDIAAVAGSFEPWWYRPTTRRIALVAAAVIAAILVAVSHFRSSPAPDAAPSQSSASPATAPASDFADDSADVRGATDSAQPDEGSTPDTLAVASTPSSVTADPANPAADDGIARPAGPQSMPPIQPSGTPRASLGSGRTTAKAGSALP